MVFVICLFNNLIHLILHLLFFENTYSAIYHSLLYFQGSLVGLENVVKPTDSNAASADSIRSCKTEPSGCFARQISNLSFSGVTGESSAGDYQDCCASSMLLIGEQQPWCPQGSESSLASDIRNSAVQRYKEKKKTRK